jgi:hypothetical protein
MATTTYTAGIAGESAKASAKVGTKANVAPAAKVGFFSRLVAAMQESRQRQAEIEIRRMRALIDDGRIDFSDALLPLKGD